MRKELAKSARRLGSALRPGSVTTGQRNSVFERYKAFYVFVSGYGTFTN